MRSIVDEQIALLDKDIIEKVYKAPSCWVSLLVIVPIEWRYRICVGICRANQAIIHERHPIPTIEDILKDMNGAEMFSKLNLNGTSINANCQKIRTI